MSRFLASRWVNFLSQLYYKLAKNSDHMVIQPDSIHQHRFKICPFPCFCVFSFLNGLVTNSPGDLRCTPENPFLGVSHHEQNWVAHLELLSWSYSRQSPFLYIMVQEPTRKVRTTGVKNLRIKGTWGEWRETGSKRCRDFRVCELGENEWDDGKGSTRCIYISAIIKAMFIV